MELSEKKIEQLNRQPIVETSMKLSEDGMWVIHKTIITDIKPRSYFSKLFEKPSEQKPLPKRTI